MYNQLKKGLLGEITQMAFRKAGNIYKLEKVLNISRSTLSRYHNEKAYIIDVNLKKLEGFLDIKIKDIDIINKLPNNWKQIKGGKNCVRNKIN